MRPVDQLLTPEITDALWRQKAACLPLPAVLFFGMDDNESPLERRAREEQAKRICAICEVRSECLQFAVETREPYGIWGGLTEIERKALVPARSS